MNIVFKPSFRRDFEGKHKQEIFVLHLYRGLFMILLILVIRPPHIGWTMIPSDTYFIMFFCLHADASTKFTVSIFEKKENLECLPNEKGY